MLEWCDAIRMATEFMVSEWGMLNLTHAVLPTSKYAIEKHPHASARNTSKYVIEKHPHASARNTIYCPRTERTYSKFVGSRPSVFGPNLQCRPVRALDSREELKRTCVWPIASSSANFCLKTRTGLEACKLLPQFKPKQGGGRSIPLLLRVGKECCCL
jgi:hypothetical protein